jgi:hypothetical protein
MNWDIVGYSAVGSACMLAKDMLGTILVDSISNGKAKLAGTCDFFLDWVSIILAAYSGVNLVQRGIWGWVGILPIAIVGGFTTYHTVQWSHENIQPEEEVEHG